MRLIAYAYHADLYCTDCGADLPGVDPEGNDKGAVFHGAEFDAIPYCGACHQPLDDYALTEDGVRRIIDYLAECAENRGITVDEDALDAALDALQPYQHALTIGERALMAALVEGDDDAAYIIARYYRAVDGDDLNYLPAPLRAYWPY